MNSHWLTARFRIPLAQPLVMGIVNVTPDSFSDGGQHASADAARAHCDRLLAEGAHILDIGGESTRPGAGEPSVQEEMDRVLPVVAHAVTLGLPVSVDTSRPELMRAALALGADIVNDVRALQLPGALQAVAEHPSAGLCLMHMQGQPRSMQAAPAYADVAQDVANFLRQRVDAALAAGIAAERITLDPGIGFGKTVAQNFSLLARQSDLQSLGYPLLAGWSRKSSLGTVTGRTRPADRVAASVAAALLAVQRGARVVRVHDVRDTVDALRVWQSVLTA